MRIDVRAILNLLFRQSHIQSFGLPIRHANNGDRRDQYLPAAKPAAGVNREIADSPGLILEIELIYRPNLAIHGPDRQSVEIFRISQHVLCLSFNRER